MTGPAKNLLEFCRLAPNPPDGGEGVEVSLVTYGRGQTENDFTRAAQAQGTWLSVLPERKRFDRQVIPLLREVVAKRKPDILQTHHVKSHCLMRLSELWCNRPWVAWHHAYTTTDFKMRCYNQLDRWSLRAPDVVMTVNGPFVEDLVHIGVKRERIRVLHNATRVGWNSGVTEETVAQLRARLGIQRGDRVVLAVGRFSLEKGHIYLIRAFAELCRALPDMPLKLVIVGEGTERATLDEAIAELGIGECVVFAGQVRDVGPFFKLADVMALPSLGEGSPNVLLESIAAGVPVVTTDVGGIPEMVVHDESALIVKPTEVGALAHELQRVVSDSVLACKLANNALVVAQRYTPEVRLSALLQLYRGLAHEAAQNQDEGAVAR